MKHPCQEDVNKPHVDLDLQVKRGGWDTAMWFRVAECHIYSKRWVEVSDGFFLIYFYYFSLWIVFAAGCSQENENLREDLCLFVSSVHRIIFLVHALPDLGFKTSYVDTVFRVSEAMAFLFSVLLYSLKFKHP